MTQIAINENYNIVILVVDHMAVDITSTSQNYREIIKLNSCIACYMFILLFCH